VTAAGSLLANLATLDRGFHGLTVRCVNNSSFRHLRPVQLS